MRTSTRFMRLSLALVAMLAWTYARTADAQDFPRLVAGQHVYGMPTGYVNPAVGMPGAAHIESALRELHHPFFVVFLDRLPGQENVAAEATHLIDRLMEAWQANHPDLFPPEASVFLMITSPREYRIMAGSRWRAIDSLDLRAGRVTRFGTEHFVPFMRRRPENPTAGILETARALDTHVFENTDPTLLRQRREAAERQVAERRRQAELRAEEERQQRLQQEHADAQRELNNELFRADTLIANDPRYLPAALGPHTVAVDAARTIQNRGGSASMQEIIDARAHLRSANDAVEAFVNDRKSAEEQAAAREAAKWGLIAFTIVALFSAYLWRRKVVRELRKELTAKIDKWQEKMDNALKRYADFDDEREAMRSLANKQGRTGALYHQVTNQVDGIIHLIEAMRFHLGATCTELGAKGGLFNTKPLHEAIEMVDKTFTFDTKVVDKTRLFHPQTVQKEINPATLEGELAAQFKTAMAGWADLKEAREAGTRSPHTDLPLAAFQALRARALAGKVPEEWLAGHPLARDAETLYARLTKLRDTDAVAYCDEIDALRAGSAQTTATVDEIIALVRPIFDHSIDADVPEGTVVDNDDSPSPHMEAAMRGEGQLAGLLKTLRPTAELRSKVNEILSQRNQATAKAENIRFAIAEAGKAIADAHTAQTTANRQRASAENRLSEVRKAHAEIEISFADAGMASIKLGDADLVSAQKALADKRHVAARRLALGAQKHFQSANQAHDQANAHYAMLEQSVGEAAKAIATADASRAKAATNKSAATQRVDAASKIHLNAVHAQRSLERAQTAFATGEANLRQAREAVGQKQHGRAKRFADAASTSFREASTACEDANHWCAEQDNKKAQYEAFIASAGRERDQAESRIRGTGRTVNLALFRGTRFNGAADYEAHLAQAVAIQASWNQAASKAESDYAEELRQAEEAAKRKREAAEAAAEADRQAAAAAIAAATAAAAAAAASSSSSSAFTSSDAGGGSFGGGGGSDGGGGSYGGGGGSDAGGGGY